MRPDVPLAFHAHCSPLEVNLLKFGCGLRCNNPKQGWLYIKQPAHNLMSKPHNPLHSPYCYFELCFLNQHHRLLTLHSLGRTFMSNPPTHSLVVWKQSRNSRTTSSYSVLLSLIAAFFCLINAS